MVFSTEQQDKYAMIFPKPFYEEYTDEYYTLKVKYNTDDLYTFYTENKNGTEDISFEKQAMFGRDEYTIKIDANGIVIAASCDEGYFRALTSLRQLMRMTPGKVRFADVHDKPVFEQRGYMYDISRSRKPKPEYIKEVIDLIAGLKYNEFQIYMEDFCFKYSAYPQFSEGYECLTPEDIKDIEKYCEERFIELVPNQNGFGHMTSWLAQDELKHLAVTDDTINPLDPESIEVIDKIYGSLLPLFKSKRVHIGMDEAMGLGKNQTEQACLEKGKATVFMDWLDKLNDLCENKYGKSVMFWGDMIINNPEVFDRIPENAVPVEWDYEQISAQYIDRRCAALKACGRKYYVAPSTMTFESIIGRFDTAEFNLRTMAELGVENGASGYLVTEWGNPMNPHNLVWSFVPIALGAQYSWNIGIQQQGGWRKPYFVHNAQKYIDEYMFGGAKVSRHLCNMANYYLLEPERVAVSTIVSGMFYLELSNPIKEDFFDVRKIGEPCQFEDIIYRMKRELAKVEAQDFDEAYKREISVNAHMVILGSEFAIAKMNGGVTKEKAEELYKLIDWIMAEHKIAWLNRDFEKGLEDFMGILQARRDEIADYIL